MFEAMKWWAAMPLCLLASSCFDGRDAHGLPCERDFQCGNGQVCRDEICVWPSDAAPGTTTSGGSASVSATDSSSSTSTGSSSSSSSGSSSSTGSSGDTTGMPPDGDAQGKYCGEGIPAIVQPRFSTTSLGVVPNPMSVVVGDFVGQGANTIAVVARTTKAAVPGVSLYRYSSGDYAELDPGIELDGDPMDAAAGDLDGDGHDDLVVVFDESTATGVRVFWGSEDTLVDNDASVGDVGPDTAFSVTAGDLNPGGRLEVVVAVGDQRREAMMFSVGADRSLGVPSTIAGMSASPWDAVTIDLDGEGPDEVLIAASNDGAYDFPGSDQVHAFGAPTGSIGLFTGVGSLPSFRTPYGVDAADLDGDGRVDIVVVGKNIPPMPPMEEKSDLPSFLYVCLQQENTDFDCQTHEMESGLSGFNNVRLADLDCDGELDALIGTSGDLDPNDGEVRIAWGPLTNTPVVSPVDAPGPIANRMAVGDVDDDGRPEVVVPIYGGDARVYDVVEEE